MPHESLYFSSILWPWHVHDDFDIFFIRAYAIFGHNVAQNLALSHHEDTFFWIQAQAIQMALVKDLFELIKVIRSIP